MKVFIAESNDGYKIYSNVEAAIFNITAALGIHNYTVLYSTIDKKVYGTAAKQQMKDSYSVQLTVHCYNENASSITKRYVIKEYEVITGDDAYSSPPAT